MRKPLKFVKEIEVVSKAKIDGFEVLFLRVNIEPAENLLTLREATEKGLVEVTEVSASGLINAIQLNNKSDKFVVCFRGDILVGGKQNRTLVTTIIVSPKSVVRIPVTCVERGRWSLTTREMKQRFKAPQMLRVVSLMEEISLPKRSDLVRKRMRVIQHSVWHEVSRRLAILDIPSETYDATTLLIRDQKDVEQKIQIPDGVNGLLFVHDGDIVGGEIYGIDVPKELIKESIISAYIDYLYYKRQEIKISSKIHSIKDLSKSLSKSKVKRKDSLFDEEAFVVKSDNIDGLLICHLNHPVFFEFIAKEIFPDDFIYT